MFCGFGWARTHCQSKVHTNVTLPDAACAVLLQVHGRVSDIWRSYVAQRLLWDAGLRVAFSPPVVDQFRSPHNYIGDMKVRCANLV
jgi:hypothetical protein